MSRCRERARWIIYHVCQVGRPPGTAGGRGRGCSAQGAPAAGGRCPDHPGLSAIEPEFHEFAGRFTHVAARFDPAHLAGQILVAATDDPRSTPWSTRAPPSAVCSSTWWMTPSAPALSSSIIDRSPIVVAVPSGGKAPVLCVCCASGSRACCPRHLGGLAELSGRVRSRAKQVLASLSDRRRFWSARFASNTWPV